MNQISFNWESFNVTAALYHQSLLLSTYILHTHTLLLEPNIASDWNVGLEISDKNIIEVTQINQIDDIAELMPGQTTVHKLYFTNNIWIVSNKPLCNIHCQWKLINQMMFQIHSITARTVPLEFRETLKKGKPIQTDSILRLQDIPD